MSESRRRSPPSKAQAIRAERRWDGQVPKRFSVSLKPNSDSGYPAERYYVAVHIVTRLRIEQIDPPVHGEFLIKRQLMSETGPGNMTTM